MSGGSGNDTLNGGKGNDTLIGGLGNDVFVYASGQGNDVIKDYTAGQDRIKLTSGSITSSSVKGSDVILNIGSGSITLKNAKGKEITVTDSSNNTTTEVYATSKSFIEEPWFFDSDLTSILNVTSESVITCQELTSSAEELTRNQVPILTAKAEHSF